MSQVGTGRYKLTNNGKTVADEMGEAIYLYLPDFPYDKPSNSVAKTVTLDSVIEYSGKPWMVNLDFDANNNLIGIEILSS